MKWIEPNEFPGNIIYQAFSDIFYRCNLHHSVFVIPRFTVLDFEHNKHYSHTGIGQPLEGEGEVESHCNEIAKSVGGNPKTRMVALFEKIRGENLIDFVKTRYEELSVGQRIHLFKLFGRLSMMDLFSGNLDRLIQVDCFKLETYPCNLGNIMLHWPDNPGGNPFVYAIDNVMDRVTLEQADAYNTFLSDLLREKEFAGKVSAAMITSIQSSIEGDDDIHLNAPSVEAFLDDLKEEKYARAIEVGLNEMVVWLTQHLIPVAQAGFPMQGMIDESLMNVIEQRMKMFLTITAW